MYHESPSGWLVRYSSRGHARLGPFLSSRGFLSCMQDSGGGLSCIRLEVLVALLTGQLRSVFKTFWIREGVSSGERLYRHMPDSQKHNSVYVVLSPLFCIWHVTCINIYDTGIKQNLIIQPILKLLHELLRA